MSKDVSIQLNLNAATIKALAAAIAAELGTDIAGPAEDSADAMTQKEFIAAVTDATKKSSKASVMAILAEFDYKNPKAVKEDDYAEILEAIADMLSGDDEEEEEDEDYDEDEEDEEDDDEDEEDEEDDDEDEEDEEEEITVDDVKDAFAAAKKVDADEAKEILSEFDLKSTRSLGKLDEDDLGELYDALMELAES